MALGDVAALQLVAVETVCRVLDKTCTTRTFGNTVVEWLSANAQTTVNGKRQGGNNKLLRLRDGCQRGSTQLSARTEVCRKLDLAQLGLELVLLDALSLRVRAFCNLACTSRSSFSKKALKS